MLDCNQIFAIYFRHCSQHLNAHCYQNQMLPFVLMFHDCLNQYGWYKLAEGECKEEAAQMTTAEETYNIQVEISKKMAEFDIIK